MRYEETRKIVLEAIMEAVEQKLINGTSGNIAMRTPEDPNMVCITPSGIPYTGMKPEDIAVVEMLEDGTNKWIEGNYKPSSEVPMHCAVMRARKDVNATVHTHSMYATICAMGDDPKLVTTTTASAQTVYSYTDPKWLDPTGHFMVVKNGNDDKYQGTVAKNNNTHHKYYGTRSDIHLWSSSSSSGVQGSLNLA